MKYLINEDCEAIRVGEFVQPKGEMEFTLNTETLTYCSENGADCDVSLAILKGIAEAHNIHVPGSNKSKAQYMTVLAEGLKSLNLPQVNTMTETDKVKEIITAGVEAEKEDDEILVEIVTSGGIPFSKARGLFTRLMQEMKLRVSNKSLKEGSTEILKGIKFDPSTWDDVQAGIDAIKAENSAASDKQCLTVIRQIAKEFEINLPKKPKATGKSGFYDKMYAWMIDNPTASDAEFAAFMTENNRSDIVIKRFTAYFDVARRMAESIVAGNADNADNAEAKT